MKRPLRGIFPILATCFHEDESIDYGSQARLIEHCIASGVHGLVTLANASEGHLMSDAERRDLAAFVVERVAGRVAVVVAVNHPSSGCAIELGRLASDLGADAVMCMPPFFGRWRASLAEVDSYFTAVDRAVGIPIILQDHQLSDIALPVDFLTSLSVKLERLRYLKLEFGNVIHKARRVLARPDASFDGIFAGNSGIFLPEEYEAGCRGTMPACYMPEQFRRTWDMLETGQHRHAVEYFAPFSRLAAYEKDIANRCLWKAILVEQGIIDSAKTREPVPSFFEEWDVAQLFRVAASAGLLLAPT